MRVNYDNLIQNDEMLADWTWFEKKCSILQGKGEKSKPIFQIILVWNFFTFYI